jgi:hypothetical protein
MQIMGHTKFNNLLAKYIARQRMYWERIVEYQLFLHRDLNHLNNFFAKIKLNILYKFGKLKQLCKKSFNQIARLQINIIKIWDYEK